MTTDIVDLAELCLYCGESTAKGTSKFSQRISVSIGVDEWAGWSTKHFPAGTKLSGWACSECMAPDVFEMCRCKECNGDCGGYIDNEQTGLCLFCYQGDCRFDLEEAEIPESPSVYRPYGNHLH